MPNRGRGHTRRSHTKSRTGCKKCKDRHIRCDENYPQCQNCTRHGVRCPYKEIYPQEGEVAPPSIIIENRRNSQIEREFQRWRETGDCPFPSLGIIQQPPLARYSETDLRLIHHISSVASQMQRAETNEHSIWVQRVPTFLRMALSNELVMHALLSLSASHLSWVKNSPPLLRWSYYHRGLAFEGLQKEIGDFSRGNSDAILAANILLSWHASNWKEWETLMLGTSTVIGYMQEWKHESAFAELIEEIEGFENLPEDRIPDPEQGRRLLHYIYTSLKRLTPYVAGRVEEDRGLNSLIDFVKNVLHNIENTDIEAQFRVLHPLRNWLVFLPVSFMKRTQEDPDVMILLAHFYAVALGVEPLFPDVGAAWFGTMAVGPILEIHRKLVLRSRRQDASPERNNHWPLELMKFPLEMVQDFRLRMGWRRPEEIDQEVNMEALKGISTKSLATSAPPTYLAPSVTAGTLSAMASDVTSQTLPHSQPSTDGQGSQSSSFGHYPRDMDVDDENMEPFGPLEDFGPDQWRGPYQE